MLVQYMWGEHGEYGPFSVGEDGYPNSGEVVRHYRVLKKLSAKQLGELYGQALGDKPKTRIWVLTMERTNDVPTDITRRRVIADLLAIPYVLLGLSESPAKKPLIADLPLLPRVPKRETLAQQSLTEYQQSLALYFAGYYHRHGQAALDDIAIATQQLGSLIPQVREPARLSGIALISRYYQFGVMIAREQQNYSLALNYADHARANAQEVHKSKPNADLLAITSYRRGITSFEKEMTSAQGGENFDDALLHVDAALSYAQRATPLMRGLILLEWSLVHAYTANTEKDKAQVRKRLEESYNYLPTYQPEDDENFLKYTPEWYHLTNAEALIALGDYTEAVGELELAEELTPLTFPRRFAYIDALRARAYIGLGEFKEAVIYAKDSLMESKAVKSEFNIARIAQIYTQLRQSYKHSSDVTELGREIAKTQSYLILNQRS